MIRLEYFTQDDYPQLIAWVHDEHLMTNWAGSLFLFPLTYDSLDWYTRGTNDPEESDTLVYKAVETTTGQPVGHISLGSINRYDASARISRVLVGQASRQGAGICQRMVKALLKIAFEDLKLHRVSLGVYDFNHAAIRCYERAGFVKEGVLRDIKRFGDEYWSLVEMSILEDEWRKQGR